MESLVWIVGGGLAMAVLALSGSITVNPMPLTYLVLVGDGLYNFIYIGASDLVPEVNEDHGWTANLLHFGAFARRPPPDATYQRRP